VPAHRVTVADLDVEQLGSGPPVVLVHGSVVDARRTWRLQRELAERWTLWMPNRPGFGASPPLERGDFELEAPLVADLLGDGAHLVGHSYGAVIALLAAAARPRAVRSLVVSEPGALRIAADNAAVDALIEQGDQLYSNGRELPAREFLLLFRSGLHSTHETPDELPAWLERGANHLARERPPWEAEIPLELLAAGSFPKLVISGGHSTAFDAVCDELADAINAERAVVSGRGHTIPSVGGAYNACVDGFLERAERAATQSPTDNPR
jgi:pimeloyl-ACP methyl ester carboxylesterase